MLSLLSFGLDIFGRCHRQPPGNFPTSMALTFSGNVALHGLGRRRDKHGGGEALRIGEAHPKTGETITVRSLRALPHALKCSAISGLSV